MLFGHRLLLDTGSFNGSLNEAIGQQCLKGVRYQRIRQVH